MKRLILPFLITAILLSGCTNLNTNNTIEEQSKNSGTTNRQQSQTVDHSNMNHGEISIKSDEQFIEAMIPHHREAVDSAKIIVKKSRNEKLKEMANNIIKAQTAEIEMMGKWYKDWFNQLPDAAMYQPMMPDLSTLEGDALDQAFIAGMIDHHRGAITMAEQIKKITKRAELLKLAADIIQAQSEEIALLQSWLDN